jgi:hypothetical protein
LLPKGSTLYGKVLSLLPQLISWVLGKYRLFFSIIIIIEFLLGTLFIIGKGVAILHATTAPLGPIAGKAIIGSSNSSAIVVKTGTGKTIIYKSGKCRSNLCQTDHSAMSQAKNTFFSKIKAALKGKRSREKITESIQKVLDTLDNI